jgi:hypothetical protein
MRKIIHNYEKIKKGRRSIIWPIFVPFDHSLKLFLLGPPNCTYTPFMGYSFKIFKVISTYYQLKTTFFNMGFDLVLKKSICDRNLNNQRIHE